MIFSKCVFQYCLSCSGSLTFPYKFQNQLFNFCKKKKSWILKVSICSLHINLKNIVILSTLCLLIQEHEYFCICIVTVQYLSTMFCSFQHIIFHSVKFIHKYFLLLYAIVFGIVSDCLLLVCTYSYFFLSSYQSCILQPCLSHLL